MNKDPAVLEAQELWKQGQQKHALQVLVRRINELNAQIAIQQPPSRTADDAPQQKREGLISKRVLMAFVLVMIVVVCGGLFYLSHTSYDKEVDTIAMKAHYSIWCQVSVIDNEEYCDLWATGLVENHREAADDCKDADPSAISRCLHDHYAPLPLLP